MKALFKTLTLTLLITSCASKPDKWVDEYGIKYRRNVSMDEIQNVSITNDHYSYFYGCRRLRIYYSNSHSTKAWYIMKQIAQANGTHGMWVRDLPFGMYGAHGYDCRNRRKNLRDMANTRLHKAALAEKERRVANENK